MGIGDFGWALSELKAGVRVMRRGWNGKNMFITFMPGYPSGIEMNPNAAKATGNPVGHIGRFDPYLLMKTANGSFVPWLASQTDLLAEDWEHYE